VFIRDLEQRLNNSSQGVSLLIADFDHFGEVNGKYGVHLGDQVLRALATLLGKCCANLPNAACYRSGGSVFDIIFTASDSPTAKAFAEFIRAQVEGFRHDGVAITVSIGLARARPNTHVPEYLCDRASEVLRRAKQNGRNRVEIAEWESEDSSDR